MYAKLLVDAKKAIGNNWTTVLASSVKIEALIRNPSFEWRTYTNDSGVVVNQFRRKHSDLKEK